VGSNPATPTTATPTRKRQFRRLFSKAMRFVQRTGYAFSINFTVTVQLRSRPGGTLGGPVDQQPDGCGCVDVGEPVVKHDDQRRR
jgi:hypothetical protein